MDDEKTAQKGHQANLIALWWLRQKHTYNQWEQADKVLVSLVHSLQKLLCKSQIVFLKDGFCSFR